MFKNLPSSNKSEQNKTNPSLLCPFSSPPPPHHQASWKGLIYSLSLLPNLLYSLLSPAQCGFTLPLHWNCSSKRYFTWAEKTRKVVQAQASFVDHCILGAWLTVGTAYTTFVLAGAFGPLTLLSCHLLHAPAGFLITLALVSLCSPKEVRKYLSSIKVSKCDLREAGLKYDTCERKQIQSFCCNLSEERVCGEEQYSHAAMGKKNSQRTKICSCVFNRPNNINTCFNLRPFLRISGGVSRCHPVSPERDTTLGSQLISLALVLCSQQLSSVLHVNLPTDFAISWHEQLTYFERNFLL